MYIQDFSTIEVLFAVAIFVAGLVFIQFFFNYAWNKKYLNLLEYQNNYQLIPFTLFGGLVCLFTLIPLFTTKASTTFSVGIVLLLLAVVHARYFYFKSLRIYLETARFDKIYKWMIIIYSLLTLYYCYGLLTEGMSALFDLTKPTLSPSKLRQSLMPYDLRSDVKLLFLPNYIFCFGAFIYLCIKSYQKREYLITFGVFFTLLSILYTNSYHLFNFEYWLPLNVMADVFELLRLNFMQKLQINKKLLDIKEKMEKFDHELNDLQNLKLNHKVFRHDLLNKFFASYLNLRKALKLIDKPDSRKEDLKDVIARAMLAQELAQKFIMNQQEVKEIHVENELKQMASSLEMDFEMSDISNSPTIVFDYQAFYNIFLNLFKNAKEANPHKEIVCMRLGFNVDDNYYHLKLSDCGLYENIPDKEKIFEAGFSSKAIEGRGLGLYSIKNLLTQQGGSIELINDNGHPCFYLKFKR
jgi:hypothetical protein